MKKQLLSLFSVCVLGGTITAQLNSGLKKIPCYTTEAMEDVFKNDPAAKSRYDLEQSQMDLEYRQAIKNQVAQKTANTAASIYTVPVVFHIMHQGGVENISDQACMDALTQLNADYNKTGADVGTISPLYSNLYVSAQIELQLAKRDPTGNCTNGIIRHYDANTNWSQTNSAAYAYSGNGTNRWPTNKYLNIYIVKCISSASSPCPPTGSFIVGYTYLPGTWSTNAANDAIVYRYDYLTGLNARSLSHELGHWLNLPHTFGSTNNPGVSCGDDGIGDTPPTLGNFSTCPPSAGTNTCDASTNQNVENFMDYSACPKMFTQNQITRVQAAINSGTSGRSNLSSPANLLATGISASYTCAPVANFAANKVINCVGNTYTFTSTSQLGNFSGGTLSWTFNGGTPATSTNSVEVVTYATPGTYTATLLATNTYSNNTKTNYTVNVVNGFGGLAANNGVDFETTGLPTDVTVRNDNAGSVTWVQNTAIGGNTTAKSIYINNFSVTSNKGQRDFFETPYYDFTNTSNITFSYYYAYAKRNAAQADSLKLQYSLDCGGTWVTFTGVFGTPNMTTFATNSGGVLATAFVPTNAQFKLITLTPSILSTLANKPSVKFRYSFMSDKVLTTGSNNIYIDQINIGGSIATFVSELEKNIGLFIYPNPTSGSSFVDFNATANDKIKISVIDVMGRVVEQTANIEPLAGNIKHEINKKESLAKGVYFVNIDINNKIISKKLIIN